MTPEKKTPLENIPVPINFKLSALWITVMFCYVYGDFFSLFVPGRIQNLMNGRSGVGTTTPLSLLSFSLLMTLPILMIFLSLVLRPAINRVLNIIIGVFFTGVMALILVTSLEEWMIFYVYFAGLEIALTSTVVWLSLKWPRQPTA